MGQIFDFMGTVTSWMDNTTFVAHYAAYGMFLTSTFGSCNIDSALSGFLTNLNGVNGDDALMDTAGNLTPLGWAYVNG